MLVALYSRVCMSFYSRDKFAKRLKFIPYILYGKTQIENEDLYQITTVNVSESSVTKHFHATLLAVGIGGWRSAFDTVLQKMKSKNT
jgi:hypothetical protein